MDHARDIRDWTLDDEDLASARVLNHRLRRSGSEPELCEQHGKRLLERPAGFVVQTQLPRLGVDELILGHIYVHPPRGMEDAEAVIAWFQGQDDGCQDCIKLVKTIYHHEGPWWTEDRLERGVAISEALQAIRSFSPGGRTEREPSRAEQIEAIEAMLMRAMTDLSQAETPQVAFWTGGVSRRAKKNKPWRSRRAERKRPPRSLGPGRGR